MPDKFLCVMAGFDAATEEKLTVLQNILYEKGFTGTQTKNIPMHLTLGTHTVEDEDRLLEIMQDVADESYDFEITFNYLGIFGGGKVLFASPDPLKELIELHSHCDFSDESWTPHATILIDEPSVILQALPHLLERFTRFTGKIERLYLYEFFPARHIATFELGMKTKQLVGKWLHTFAPDIPEDMLRDHVLKSCNLLWHAFTWGKAECLEGEDAKRAFDELDYTEAICFEGGYSRFDFPRINKVRTVGKLTSADLDEYYDIYITAPDFSWTYVHTHEAHLGPYFCEK